MLQPSFIRLAKFLLTGVAFGTVVNWTLFIRYSLVRGEKECLQNDLPRYASPRELTENTTAKYKNKNGVISLTNLENAQHRETGHVYKNRSNGRRIRLMEDIPGVVYEAPYGYTPSHCKSKVFNISKLPSTSVIITYHDNENAVDILRTIESILRRTPKSLLKEILLVDDHSSKEELVSVMEQYLESVYVGNVVRIVRNPEKRGLIQARHFGITQSVGDVVVCMDSHMEVQDKWLEPLLETIVENPNTLASSYLDWIEYKTVDGRWNYKVGGSSWKTYFDWRLEFGFQDISWQELNNRPDLTAPIESPIMVGTLWAMRRETYRAVGGLDQNLEGWGGENIDLPLKVWLSGGRVVNVPCSHAAHVEDPHKRFYRNGKEWRDKIDKNYERIAEKWLGDYKKYFNFYKAPLQPGYFHVRNITTQRVVTFDAEVTLRDFNWFLKNVFPELGLYDVDSLAHGYIRNAKYNKSCLLGNIPNQPGISYCNDYKKEKQIFTWSSTGELRLQVHIINRRNTPLKDKNDIPLGMDGYITAYNSSSNLKWFHSKGGNLAVSVMQVVGKESSISKLCLTASNGYTLTLQSCNQSATNQRWIFDKYTQLYDNVILNSLDGFRDLNYISELAAYIKQQTTI